MPQHRIKFYMDGRIKIDYCTICSKEGRDLIDDLECVVDKKNSDQGDFLIDKHKERN